VNKIERAFGWRDIPSSAIDRASILQFDSDVEDADWFSGKEWCELTLEDWRTHMCAYTFMSSEAAPYYLPSLLIISAQKPEEWISSLDSLIIGLDCTPEWGVQDERIRARYLGWKIEEYEALQEWFLFMSEHAPDLAFGTSGPGDSFGRAFELVELLKRETILSGLR
jgi:hypothetical protein